MNQPATRPLSALRTKFFLYTSAVALALFGIGAAAVVSVNLSSRALEAAIEDALKEQYPVLRIEKLVRKAEMEAHDFLMYGNESHREQYRIASENVDRAFEDLLDAHFDMQTERTLAQGAFEQWKTLTAGMLNYTGQAAGADPLSAMEGFDRHVEEILKGLETLLQQVSREIEGNLTDAYVVKMRLLFLVTALFLVCLAMVILLGVGTARSILAPVYDLTQGVLQIARGEYSRRVPVRGRNELTLLSQAFNTMAERLEQDQKMIEQLSLKDSQTGLYNRAFFESMLADEIQLLRRSQGVFSILRLDLTEFETLRAGHPESALLGILQSAAATIAGNIRGVDRGAYLGDGRFGVILRDTPEAGARSKAKALRASMEAAGLSPPHPSIPHVDLAIGVAAYSREIATGHDLIRAAEADMERGT